MAFRENFVLWSFVHAITLLTNVLFFKIIFSSIPSLNGWTEYESLLILGISSLISGVGSLTFFSFMYSFSGLIKTGDFDFLLIRPMDVHFQSAFDGIDMEDLAVVPSALIVIIYSLINIGKAFNLLSIFLMFLMIINSLVFIFSLITLIESFAFKSVEIRNASAFVWDFVNMTKYPAKSLRNVPLIIGYMLIPVAFITTVPAEVALGKASPVWVGGALLTTISLFLFSRWLFFRRLKYYSSASS